MCIENFWQTFDTLERMSEHNTNQLHSISNAYKSDTAKYRCVAENIQATTDDRMLTLQRTVASDGYISKCSVPSRSNLHF